MFAFKRLPWPPVYDRKSDRLVGFYPHHVKDVRDLEKFSQAVARIRSETAASRISIRGVFDGSRIGALGSGMEQEAVIPLDSAFFGSDLLYLAWVHDSRKNKVNYAPPDYQPKIFDSSTYMAYQICRHTSINMYEAAELALFFRQKFADYPTVMSADAIAAMPEDHLVFTARDAHGRLVGVFMADALSARVGEHELCFFEFNHVVISSARYAALIILMARELIEATNPYKNAIIFAETREDSPLLNAACDYLGMSYAGTLNASFRLCDAVFGSSFPTYKNARVLVF